MSLYRRGEWWWIDIASDAGRIREPARTTNRKEAEAFHRKRENEVWQQDKLGVKPPVTWGEAVQKWMSLRPRPLQDRYLIASFGFSLTSALPLSEESVTKQLSRPSMGGAAGSWNRYLSLIVAIHNASGVQPPPVKRKKAPAGRTRWLTAEEWERLRKALGEESETLRDLASFSIHTGVRENNALELRWDQVDLRRRVAWFYADRMKAGVAHGIPLNDAAMSVLASRKGIHKTYVFPAPDTGLPYTKASNRAWYAALKKSRLKGTGVVWHTLRHTWASWAVMSGVRLEEVMRLGGWKTYSMVLRYAHLAPEHLSQAASMVRPVSRKGHTGA